jgi:hypothetical protein
LTESAFDAGPDFIDGAGCGFDRFGDDRRHFERGDLDFGFDFYLGSGCGAFPFRCDRAAPLSLPLVGVRSLGG